MLFLISKVLVSGRTLVKRSLLYACRGAPRVIAANDHCRIGHSRSVGGQRIRSLKRQMAQLSLKHISEPRLFMCVPRTGNVPCRQPTTATILSQSVGSFITIGTVKRITTFP